MLKRGIPIHVVQMIAFWYQSQELQIRWGKVVSEPFFVTNGIRQGGILSLFLFNIILDDLSEELNKSKLGCIAGNLVINHLSYADDMVLLTPSARALQTLINICNTFASQNYIVYNTDKTKCMIFWPKMDKNLDSKFELQGERLSLV